jgi:hypothetical protein
LLDLANCRAPLTDIAQPALEPVCHMRIVVSNTPAMSGIVYPPVSVAYIGTVEAISADEIVVDEDIVISPATVPPPVGPAATPDCSQRKARSE